MSLFFQLYYNVISLTGLKIARLNAWVGDNLPSLDMLLLSIIAKCIKSDKSRITLALLFITWCFVKMEFYFYL